MKHDYLLLLYSLVT